MKILVLGGCGIQGRAALYDLSRNAGVVHITCADIQPDIIHTFTFLEMAKIQPVGLDANDPNALASIMDEKFDIVLDFLPSQSTRTVAEAAIKNSVHLVNTNYAYDILDLDHAAKEKGISIIPECGLDPGIDLILYKYSLKYFGPAPSCAWDAPMKSGESSIRCILPILISMRRYWKSVQRYSMRRLNAIYLLLKKIKKENIY